MLAETAYNVAQALDDTQKARLLSMLQKDVDAAVLQLKPVEDPYTSVADYKEWLSVHYKQSNSRMRIINKPEVATSGFNHF